MNQISVSVRARWILAVDQPPIEHGVVAIRDGKIASIDRTSRAKPDVDLGEAILFPQMINAHTHLEFSQWETARAHAPATFSSWLRQVIESRRTLDAWEKGPAMRSAIQAGLTESRSAAVSVIGEISSLPGSALYDSDSNPTCVVFHERLGLATDSIEATITELTSVLATPSPGGRPLRMGISPHAPYSTHIELVRELVRLANRLQLPIAMHLAESQEELDLLSTRRGPLRELLENLNVWHADAIPMGTCILDYLKLLSTSHCSLVVHGNYLTEQEIDFIALHRERMHVAFCPRTHAFFGHDRYPLQQFLRRGIGVSIATDSRASSPDLSVANEIAFAANSFPEIDPKAFLEMATLNPARSLGVDSFCGSITPGKLARLAVIELNEQATGNPEQLWLEGVQRSRPLVLPLRAN